MQVLKIASYLVSFCSRTTTMSRLLHTHIKTPSGMTHKPSDPSMYNYLKMRSHVTSPILLIWKKIDNALHRLFPNRFIPLYSMVAFTRIPYHQVVGRHSMQQLRTGETWAVASVTHVTCHSWLPGIQVLWC